MAIRKRLTWNSATIGVYVGKFGGLYYEADAYDVFAPKLPALYGPSAHHFDTRPIQRELEARGIPAEHRLIFKAQHDEVFDYLSAADFGYALYHLRPRTPSKVVLSPIKNGEYWANGLPVLMTDGVGDEATFLEAARGRDLGSRVTGSRGAYGW